MLRQLTIQTNGGLPIFHLSVGGGVEFEPMLFSSFTTALMMFTKEMGTELTGIHLGGVEYFFKKIGEEDLIVIIGVQDDDDRQLVETILKELEENENLMQIFRSIIQKQVIDPQDAESCQEQILKLLAIHALLPAEPQGISARHTREIQLIESVTKELRQRKTSPKRLAEKIFNEGLQNADPKLVSSSIIIIREFVNSSSLDVSLKKKMNELLKYLEHFMKMARMIGFRADDQ